MSNTTHHNGPPSLSTSSSQRNPRSTFSSPRANSTTTTAVNPLEVITKSIVKSSGPSSLGKSTPTTTAAGGDASLFATLGADASSSSATDAAANVRSLLQSPRPIRDTKASTINMASRPASPSLETLWNYWSVKGVEIVDSLKRSASSQGLPGFFEEAMVATDHEQQPQPSEAIAALQNAADEVMSDAKPDSSSVPHSQSRSGSLSSRPKNLLRRRSSFPNLVLRTPIGMPASLVEGFTRSGLPTPNTLNVFRGYLPDDCFFSAVMLVRWSNVLGPKVDKIWVPEQSQPDDKMLENTAKQILNGEIGRNVTGIEPKFLVLGDEGIIATSFLFTEYASPATAPASLYNATPSSSTSTFPSYFPPSSPPPIPFFNDDSRRRYTEPSPSGTSSAGSLDPTRLAALTFIVPVLYMSGFAPYFEIMVDRVPGLVEKLRRLKKGGGMPWKDALDYFAFFHLIPFVEQIRDLESMALPLDCVKISHTTLANENGHMFELEFLARVITSHLETQGSTVILGTNITVMNILINTLALFLTPAERNRSSHASKEHQYLADLFLQGILVPSQDQPDTHLDYLILESPRPTTLVDLTRPSVEQTDLLPGYARTRAEFYKFMATQMEDRTYAPGSTGNRTGSTDTDTDEYLWTASSPGGEFVGWSRPVFQPVKHAAPMVRTLLTDLFRLPSGMREAYVRQWRRWLVRKGLELIKVVEDETNAPPLSPSLLSALGHHSPSTTASSTRRSSISSFVNRWRFEEVPAAPATALSSLSLPYLLHTLALADERDFDIVLAQAEKLRPGMVEFVRVYLGVG